MPKTHTVDCPSCGADLSEHMAGVRPRRGDAAVCPECTQVLVFDITLREPTLAEMVKWSEEEHMLVWDLQERIREKRRLA